MKNTYSDTHPPQSPVSTKISDIPAKRSICEQWDLVPGLLLVPLGYSDESLGGSFADILAIQPMAAFKAAKKMESNL